MAGCRRSRDLIRRGPSGCLFTIDLYTSADFVVSPVRLVFHGIWIADAVLEIVG